MRVGGTNVACSALLLVGILSYLASLGDGPGSPVGLAGPGEVALGDVEPREGIPVDFELRVVGDQPATILSVTRSCDCTVLEDVEGRRVEAGGTLVVRGAIDARGRRGPFRSALYLSYRLGAEESPRRFRLTVTATVREAAGAAPVPPGPGAEASARPVGPEGRRPARARDPRPSIHPIDGVDRNP